MPGIYPHLVHFIINPSNNPNGDLITIEFTWYSNGSSYRTLFFNDALYLDGTKDRANADVRGLVDRAKYEAEQHLEDLWDLYDREQHSGTPTGWHLIPEPGLTKKRCGNAVFGSNPYSGRRKIFTG